MDGTEKDKQLITADTLNATKIGIPASFAAILAAIALAADKGDLANQPMHLTIAVFGLAAIGVICATALAVTDYVVRSRVTIAKAGASSVQPASTAGMQPAAVYFLMTDGKPTMVEGEAVEITANGKKTR
jgi:hypothetical protein